MLTWFSLTHDVDSTKYIIHISELQDKSVIWLKKNLVIPPEQTENKQDSIFKCLITRNISG